MVAKNRGKKGKNGSKKQWWDLSKDPRCYGNNSKILFL